MTLVRGFSGLLEELHNECNYLGYRCAVKLRDYRVLLVVSITCWLNDVVTVRL